MRTTPSPGYTITIRLEITNQVGMFGKIATAIGEIGGDIGAVDIVRAGKGFRSSASCNTSRPRCNF